MTLDERLERARDDYRALAVPAPSTTPPRRSSSRRPAWSVAAAAVLLTGAVGGWLAVRDRDNGPGDGRVRTDTPAAPPAIERPPGDPEVVLAPVGPYQDGQEVTVRFDDTVDVDVSNGIELCVTVAVDETTTVERCDRRGASTPDPHAARLSLPRSVVTPLGVRDCEAPEVDCRFVVETSVGGRTDMVVLRSDSLRFTGPMDLSTAPALALTPTGVGALRVEPAGLAPDQTWLDLRTEHPGLVVGFPAFFVSLCAPGATAVVPEPPGGGPGWGMAVTDRTENCDTLGEPFTVDPDDPNAVVEAEVRRLLFGFVGRSDCAAARCYLLVSRATENAATEGGVGGNVEAVAAAPLPVDLDLGPAVAPSLTIETPGPHRLDDEVEVTVAGLPTGVERSIALCSPDTAASCGLSLTTYGNGTHRLTLRASIGGCDPSACVLAIFSGIKGVPPLATAPLDLS